MKILVRLLLLALAVGAFAGYRIFYPYKGFEGEVFVEIPHGTSRSEMAERLAKAGVVRGQWEFLTARFFSTGHVLQAGEYRFEQPASAAEVYDRIARGDVYYIELLVPEGKNMFDIGAAAEQLHLFKAAEFVAAAKDPAMIRDLDPQAPSLEGFLFPNTYRVGRHTTPERLCRLMTAKFREAWQELHTEANVHRTVTLASLVEKEGKLAEERPQIAAVFENRLRIGMKLDCDPTTIYAALLANRYRGTIYRSDLDSRDPYNTYQHAGLPPGPIANPGLASIRAVLQPAVTDALFFVLRPDGSGGHQFSNNMAAHEAAIANYRRGLQK
jgi:peptidoglycan lytic transglycosylase G